MDKIIRYMQNYLIYGFLFSLVMGILPFIHPIPTSGFIRYLFNFLSDNFIPWFLTLIMYLVCLVTIPSVRDKKLRRLANLKEQDEREEYITGKAARAAYIATFSLLLVCLFFSLLNFSVTKTPSNTGKLVYSFGVGIHYNLFHKPTNPVDSVKYLTFFNSDNYALSSSTLILFFLCWQILAFNIAAKRLQD